MSCEHPNGICDCKYPWQAWADYIDPQPLPLSEVQMEEFIARLKGRGVKIKQQLRLNAPENRADFAWLYERFNL